MDNDIIYRSPPEVELMKALQVAQIIEELYGQAISMISEIVWRYDVNAQGDLISFCISPAADRLLGLPAGSIGDRFEKYFSYICPEDQPAAKRMFQEATQSSGKAV